MQKQLAFFDLGDKLPLPLLVSNKWLFELQFDNYQGVMLYSVHDWISGLVGCDNKKAGELWRRFKISEAYLKSDSELIIEKMPYHANDGKRYKRDFCNDIVLLLLAQYLRATQSRPMIDEIRDYLANAGALLDDWRRNPDKMLSVAQSRMLQDIERHEKAGLGDRPEIALLKARHESIVTSETLRKTIARVCDNPNYAQITNAEYMALFGKIAKDLKELLNTKSIRDSLGIHQIRALTLAEGVLEDMLRRNRETTNESILGIIEIAIKPIGRYLLETSQALGVHHITGKPLLGSGE